VSAAATTAARKEELHRQVVRLEWFTIAWNVVEAVVAVGVGIAVSSVALWSHASASVPPTRGSRTDLGRSARFTW
jgi:hypothetical protein